MLPFSSQTGSNPTNSALNTLYTSLLAGMGTNLNQLLPSMSSQNYIDAVYTTLFLQNSQMLLDSALLSKAQKDSGLSNQLWHRMIAPITATKSLSSSKVLSGVGSSINCDLHSKTRLDTCVNANTSLDITKACLDQNLELSEMKKSKPSAFTKHQKVTKTSSAVESNSCARDCLSEKAQMEGDKKKIWKTDAEPRNQLEQSTRCDPLIKSLEPNDCAFDSNDGSDTEHNVLNKTEKHRLHVPIQQQYLKEEPLVPQEQSVVSTRYNDEKYEMKTEKSKNNFEDDQLAGNELDELNSSFSSDDCSGTNIYADFQLL